MLNFCSVRRFVSLFWCFLLFLPVPTRQKNKEGTCSTNFTCLYWCVSWCQELLKRHILNLERFQNRLRWCLASSFLQFSVFVFLGVDEHNTIAFAELWSDVLLLCSHGAYRFLHGCCSFCLSCFLSSWLFSLYFVESPPPGFLGLLIIGPALFGFTFFYRQIQHLTWLRIFQRYNRWTVLKVFPDCLLLLYLVPMQHYIFRLFFQKWIDASSSDAFFHVLR